MFDEDDDLESNLSDRINVYYDCKSCGHSTLIQYSAQADSIPPHTECEECNSDAILRNADDIVGEIEKKDETPKNKRSTSPIEKLLERRGIDELEAAAKRRLKEIRSGYGSLDNSLL